MAQDVTAGLADLLRGKQILVVDDQRLSRHIVVRFFAGTDCAECVQATDGTEGLAALADPTHDIGLVICDFNMPGLNGLELLKSIRIGVGGVRNDLPVIMLTGNSDGRLVGVALALDVDAFVLKPVSKAVLMARLRHVLTVPRTVKTPKECAAIDVDTVGGSLNGPSSPNGKKADADLPPAIGREVELGILDLPATLCRDIRAPTGELLLASGVTLTRRLVDRLVELNGLGIPVRTVWVL